MQEKINKIIWILIPLLIIGLLIWHITLKNEGKEYTRNFFYMDTYIYVKLYETDSKKAERAFQEIETIYQEYHKLADRYQSYDDIVNLYTIHNNTLEVDTITLDQRLYDMISYGKKWYDKSNGKLDISMGDVLDVWKQYRDNQNGIPTIEELEQNDRSNIEDIILLDNNQIKNNHVNIDLGAIAKGYATEMVGEYLESIGIYNYLINAGGNVKVGIPQNKNKFSIGIEDPNSKQGEICKIVYGKNISVVTSGGYERYYEYNGQKYHHIIDPDTLMPANHMKSVTVIADDSRLGDILSTVLFLMPIEEGQMFIENENAEAIWHNNENQIITSSGMNQYEQK